MRLGITILWQLSTECRRQTLKHSSTLFSRDAQPEGVLCDDGGGLLLDGRRVADGAVAGLASKADRVLLVREMRH